MTYGKALALALKKPLIAVNHLEGHVHAVISKRTSPRAIPCPPSASSSRAATPSSTM